MSDLKKLKQGQSIERSFYRHTDGQFSPPVTLKPNRFIISEGLHPFYLSDNRQLLDIKLFLDTDEKLRIQWKLQRDQLRRGHNQQTVLKQIKFRQKDAREFIAPQKQFADIIISHQLVGNARSQDVCLTITCNNSLDLGSLIEAFNKNPYIELEHWYQDDLERQSVRFYGSIGSNQIAEIAYHLLPSLEDLIENKPKWRSDYEGINQLFLLYCYAKLQEKYYGQ